MPVVSVSGLQYSIDLTPTECPRCHNKIAAVQTGGGASPTLPSGLDVVQIMFKCPACDQVFFGVYAASRHPMELFRTEPTSPVAHSFGPVDALSPQFKVIYNEAAAAEAYELQEIAGLAYRKSLEFLVKDYCIHLKPEDETTIKGAFLSKVIKEYLGETMIGRAAEKATWLGNDEAHYVRKWEQHDISSLKALLRIVVSAVTEKLEYESLMASFEPPAAT